MKKTIKIFVEGKPPVKYDIDNETRVSDIISHLKIKRDKISAIYISDNEKGPSGMIGSEETLIRKSTSYWPSKKTEYTLRGQFLWIGFYPKKGETKYTYNWVGNQKTNILESKLLEEFGNRARYHEGSGSYSIQGIEAKDTGSLLELYIKARNYLVIKD